MTEDLYMVVVNLEDSESDNLEIADYNLSLKDAKKLADEIGRELTSFSDTVRIVKHERF